MITDQFKHEVGTFLQDQAARLLTHQGEIASATYRERSGKLTESLNHLPYPNGTRIELSYPIHIRFLDMKKGRNGKGKKRYAPIYNKYVYGYLKSDVARKLNRLVPDIMINAIKDPIK